MLRKETTVRGAIEKKQRRQVKECFILSQLYFIFTLVLVKPLTGTMVRQLANLSMLPPHVLYQQ